MLLFVAFGAGVRGGWYRQRCKSTATPHEERIAACERSCRNGNDSCMFLSNELREAPTTPERVARSVTILEDFCERGNADACRAIAVMFDTGKEIKMDVPRSFVFYDRACKKGHDTACLEVGIAYYLGQGIAKDPAIAVGYFDRMCTRGTAGACSWFGHAHREGSGVVKDLVRAQSLYEKDCNVSRPKNCAGFAVGLAGFDDDEPQPPKDAARALRLLRDGCDHGEADACRWHGYALRKGNGIEKNLPAAFGDFERACILGDAIGCTDLGEMLSLGEIASIDRASADRRAVKVFRLGCEGKCFAACDWLGLHYASGRGVEKNVDAAIESYTLGCNNDNGGSCASLGIMLAMGEAVPKDDARAFALLDKACAKNDGAGCDWLAMMYAEGRGVAKDDVKSFSTREKACKANFASACLAAGNALWTGTGTKQDVAAANEHFRRACDLGEKKACEDSD